MNSCIVCTCMVSPQCEWGSGPSNYYFGWMTCCTVNSCISFLLCGSSYVGKGYIYLQSSWDTSHKTFDLPSLNETSSPSPWLSLLITAVKINVKIYHSIWSLSLLPTKVGWRWKNVFQLQATVAIWTKYWTTVCNRCASLIRHTLIITQHSLRSQKIFCDLSRS